MQSFTALSAIFEEKFNVRHFPEHTKTLYDPAQYILGLGGKRIRPAAVYMANELFGETDVDTFNAAAAIELFHNFSLIHDDIMDKAPLRRGQQTVHEKYGENTALLAGDVMFVTAYEYLSKIKPLYLPKVVAIFNKTAKEVCEGQQLDMDFEKQACVSLDAYVSMISLKTSVLLGSSLQTGAILGGAGLGNQQHLYAFGKNLGIAFQVQDDYLDAFGNPEKFGKQIGGDIIANKKTFLMIHALEVATEIQKKELNNLMNNTVADKVEKVLQIFSDCKVEAWATALKEKYYDVAMKHLEDVAVMNNRKTEVKNLAEYILQRES